MTAATSDLDGGDGDPYLQQLGTNTVSLTAGNTTGVNTYTVTNAVAVTAPVRPDGPGAFDQFGERASSLILSWPGRAGCGWWRKPTHSRTGWLPPRMIGAP